MYLVIFLLIGFTLLAGFSAFLLPRSPTSGFEFSLVFAGAFLFSVTVLHLLPELFAGPADHFQTGLFVLMGFFLQRVLEYFTAGVEHGHLHPSANFEGHQHQSALFLIGALCLHAFLEGSLLKGNEIFTTFKNQSPLLVGIILHKMPAAFALMSVLLCQFKQNVWPVLLLILFTLSTPLGMVFWNLMQSQNLLSESTLWLVLALVSGNFLYISTTIFYESNPSHGLNPRKLVASFLGAGLAIFAEFMT